MTNRASQSKILAPERRAQGELVGRRKLLTRVGVPVAAAAAGTAFAQGSSQAAVAAQGAATSVTIAEIRALTDVEPGAVYVVTDGGAEGVFYHDPDDTSSPDNTGTVLVTAGGHRFKRVFDGPLAVTWFGAVGDGSADDTVAIQTAIDHATSLTGGDRQSLPRPVVYFPSGTGYRTTDTVNVPVHVNLSMDSPIAYAGPADRPALVVGQSDERNLSADLTLWVVRDGTRVWSNEDHVGVLLQSLYFSKVNIVEVNGFTIGLQCIGVGAGFVHNEVRLGVLLNNRFGLDITNRNPGTGIGWCNENLFLGGQFQCHSNVMRGTARTGVRITSMDETYTRNNNNHFYKPSFELRVDAAEPAEALAVLVEHGRLNGFYDFRTEGISRPEIRVLNDSMENTFEQGWGQLVVDGRATYPSSIWVSARARIFDFPSAVFNSGAVRERACYYDGDTRIHIPGLGFGRAQDSSVQPAGAMLLGDGYVEASADGHDAPGVFIDTSGAKRFVVKTDAEEGHTGRIHVVAYDGDGNILADPGGGAGSALVKTKVTFRASWEPGLFGGCYRTVSDHADTIGNEFSFTAADEVKAVRVLLWRGTEALRLRAFSIYALEDTSPRVWPGWDEPAGNLNVGTTHPRTGTWPRGMTVVNAEPAAVTGRARMAYIVDGWRKVTEGAGNETGVDWLEMRAYQTLPFG